MGPVKGMSVVSYHVWHEKLTQTFHPPLITFTWNQQVRNLASTFSAVAYKALWFQN